MTARAQSFLIGRRAKPAPLPLPFVFHTPALLIDRECLSDNEPVARDELDCCRCGCDSGGFKCIAGGA